MSRRHAALKLEREKPAREKVLSGAAERDEPTGVRARELRSERDKAARPLLGNAEPAKGIAESATCGSHVVHDDRAGRALPEGLVDEKVQVSGRPTPELCSNSYVPDGRGSGRDWKDSPERERREVVAELARRAGTARGGEHGFERL
jgi:hypothetical protein